MAGQLFLKDSRDSPSSPASDVTQAEWTFTDRTTLRAFFDAKNWTREKSGNSRITTWWSFCTTVFGGVLYANVAAVSEAFGAYWGIVPGGTLREEIRVGIDASNTVTSGFNNKIFTGNAQFVVPAGDFTLDYMIRFLTISSVTVILGTVDTTAPMMMAVTSTGTIRIYSAYTSGLVATSSAAFPLDLAYHRLKYRYDHTAKTVEISVDGSIVKAATSIDLSGHVGQVLQLGTITSSGPTQTAGSGYALQGFYLDESIDNGAQPLYTAILAERAA